MAGEIKAIETRYKGYRFRSRLEARWAVFFDSLGVKWEYEKQGYNLPTGPYLPDFWIPHLSSWIEIKGQEPSEDERDKCVGLAEVTTSPVYLIAGLPPYTLEELMTDAAAELFWPDGSWGEGHAFCCCAECGFVGLEFEGRANRLACKECVHCTLRNIGHYCDGEMQCQTPDFCANRSCDREVGNLDRGRGDVERVLAAGRSARSARFEHGESPR